MPEVEHARRGGSRGPRGRRRALPSPKGGIHGAAAHEGEGALDEEHSVAYAEEPCRSSLGVCVCVSFGASRVLEEAGDQTHKRCGWNMLQYFRKFRFQLQVYKSPPLPCDEAGREDTRPCGGEEALRDFQSRPRIPATSEISNHVRFVRATAKHLW